MTSRVTVVMSTEQVPSSRSWHRRVHSSIAIIGCGLQNNNTVEPPNKGHFGNGPLVLCSEVVPISEVHDFSIHFDCIILNKLVNALKCMIRAVEMIIKWLVCSVFSVRLNFFCF